VGATEEKEDEEERKRCSVNFTYISERIDSNSYENLAHGLK
jgi:hypothetical protein